MKLSLFLTIWTLAIASVSQAKIIDVLSCQATSARANVQKFSLHRDDQDDQLAFGKNLIVRMELIFDEEPVETKLDYGFDSTPTSTRLKIAETPEHKTYFFDSSIGGNFSGAGAQHRYAILIEDKNDSQPSDSIGSQIEFLDCK